MKVWVFILLMAAQSAMAEIPRAYRIIADQYGIPADVFFAIALQESGKSGQDKFLPWPWTLNIDKKGHYFETREEAEIALLTAMDKAAREGKVGRVAVGIGQIYMPSHAHRFDSVIEALDPTINLNYAAQLLVEHFVNTWREGSPDWWQAVGRYHSPSNHALAKEYRELVYRKCQKISVRCNEYGRSALGIHQALASND